MRKPPKNTQEMLPGYSSYQLERDKAIENQVNRLSAMWQAGLTGDKLYTARMLIQCGLPVSKSDSMEPVVRTAKIGDESRVRVSFIRTHGKVPLPYGADRTLMYFLTNKAVLQGSPILKWEHAREYMDLFGMNDSGKNHRAVQERFTRLAYMDIMVEHLDYEGNVTEHWKCPLIDHARISAVTDAEGNWKPSMSIAAMLAKHDQAVTFGLRFFHEVKNHPVPIPIELLLAAGKQYRLMDYMIFLYWRAFAAQSQSFIPFRYLQQQFDSEDSNDTRWPRYFRRAYEAMKALPEPINQIRADISIAGVTIYPYAPGTTFFADQPKLGLRRALAPENL